jgi:uncharacterized protein with GYD domain
MPNYVALVNWTDQGIRNVKETIQRADRAAELAQKHGCSMQNYWTLGPYVLLEIASGGAVRTTTLRAYDREEMSGIIQRLG